MKGVPDEAAVCVVENFEMDTDREGGNVLIAFTKVGKGHVGFFGDVESLEEGEDMQPSTQAAFIPATTFTPRPGYAFKTGPIGLGFYLDSCVKQEESQKHGSRLQFR